MKNYIKIQCPCGRINKVPIEDEVFKPGGRPEPIAVGTCSVCNRRIIAWRTISYMEIPAGTHKNVVYID